MTSDFEQDPTDSGWILRVNSKGGRKGNIVVPTDVLDALARYRVSLGLHPLPSSGDARPVIGSIIGERGRVTPQALYMLVKSIFCRAAERIEAERPAGAERLRRASTHWMRHTGISHLLDADVDPRVAQAQARHSTLATTSRYDHKDRTRWREQLERTGRS